ncbi:UNVERIFIED_ORG: hypothetical protein FHR35_009166 [Microbispora rosea subsp. rosea]
MLRSMLCDVPADLGVDALDQPHEDEAGASLIV